MHRGRVLEHYAVKIDDRHAIAHNKKEAKDESPAADDGKAKPDPVAVAGGYLASKNSKVFHRAGCEASNRPALCENLLKQRRNQPADGFPAEQSRLEAT